MKKGCLWSYAIPSFLISCLYPPVNSFVPCNTGSKARRTSLGVSNHGREESLYDILGASPNDSQRLLKSRYAELAKLTHPDANNGGDSRQFSKIAAAWSVLGDPKERLRYDRSLKAKEFTSSVESFLDVGIKNAVPFIKKTADTTLAAVETSSKTMKGVSTQLGRAKDRFELDQKCRDIEQQASAQFLLAKKFKAQSENINEKRHKTLNSPNSMLTSADARRLLDTFVTVDKKISTKSSTKGPVSKEITTLDVVEADFRTKQGRLQDSERQVLKAEREAENAKKAQELAQERLLQAQRELDQANKAIESCQATSQKAVSQKEKASLEVDKVSGMLDRQREKVRNGLVKKESETLQSEADHLKKKSELVEQAAKKLEKQAQELRAQSAQMQAEHRKLEMLERQKGTQQT